MSQGSVNFPGGRSPRRYRNTGAHAQWAEIVLANPTKYPSPLLRSVALAAMHRQRKQHDSEGCPLCLPPTLGRARGNRPNQRNERKRAGMSARAKGLNARQEKFAATLGSGSNATSAYIAAGYSKNGAAQGAERLLRKVEIKARIRGLISQVTEATLQAAIECRKHRIALYQDMLRRLWRIVQERGSDPAMIGITGGRSGFIVRQFKVLGVGASQKMVPEYVVDTALSRALRGVMEQAARELGQWTEKQELTGKDGGKLSIELLDGWLAESGEQPK